MQIYDTNNFSNKPVCEISIEDWELIEPLLLDLFPQWGDFIGPYVDGVLHDYHLAAIFERIKDQKKISSKVLVFFENKEQLDITWYVHGD